MKFSTLSRLLNLAVLALAGLVLSHNTANAQFAPTMLLCVSDFATPSNCTAGSGGGSDYVVLESDGTSVMTTFSGGTFQVLSDITTGNNIISAICLGGTVVMGSCTGNFLTVDTGSRSYTTNPVMDLSFQDHALGAGTLNIWWSVSGFTTGAPFSGSIGGTNDASTIAWLACIENSTASDPAALPVCGTPPPQGDTIGFGSSSDPSFHADFSSLAMNSVTPFGLEEQVQIVTTGAGVSSGDMALRLAPEPTSILLLGGALLAAAAVIRRKVSTTA